MKEQWQRKKAPLSEQESIKRLMKKKKEKREPQKDSKKQLSISQRFSKCTKRRLAAWETTCGLLLYLCQGVQ